LERARSVLARSERHPGASVKCAALPSANHASIAPDGLANGLVGIDLAFLPR
jgi:hypothetical protein